MWYGTKPEKLVETNFMCTKFLHCTNKIILHMNNN